MSLTGVPRTALITLRARADEHQKRGHLFADPWAVEWLEKIGWPKELKKHYSRWLQSKTAIRSDHIDALVRDCATRFEADRIVELACGLSSRRQRLDFQGRWFDLDLPEIIAVREELGIGGPQHQHLSRSVLDLSWLDAIGEGNPEQTIVIAEGLFYYLPKIEVLKLFQVLRRRLPGATIIFDVIGQLDWDSAQAYNKGVEAPLHWATPVPFERGMVDLGVATIPGLEPEVVLHDSINRAPLGIRWLLGRAAKNPAVVEARSGIMVGWLAPLS